MRWALFLIQLHSSQGSEVGGCDPLHALRGVGTNPYELEGFRALKRAILRVFWLTRGKLCLGYGTRS